MNPWHHTAAAAFSGVVDDDVAKTLKTALVSMKKISTWKNRRIPGSTLSRGLRTIQQSVNKVSIDLFDMLNGLSLGNYNM